MTSRKKKVDVDQTVVMVGETAKIVRSDANNWQSYQRRKAKPSGGNAPLSEYKWISLGYFSTFQGAVRGLMEVAPDMDHAGQITLAEAVKRFAAWRAEVIAALGEQ